MKLICISDTHSSHRSLQLPEGDMLIHAGDVSNQGHLKEIRAFNTWLERLSYAYKLVVAGNHDWLFELYPEQARETLTAATYLENEGVVINGLKFWGSPVSPWFCDWAFNVHRGKPIRQVWQQIPIDTDVLIVHGPPYGILDQNRQGEHCGCKDLLERILDVRPQLVIFGHIHEGYGQIEYEGIRFVNACSLDYRYRPVNAPLVIEI